jgi:hypothetical protein
VTCYVAVTFQAVANRISIGSPLARGLFSAAFQPPFNLFNIQTFYPKLLSGLVFNSLKGS